MSNGKENIIVSKTYSFALRAIKLYVHLKDDKREFILSKQFLRSATSIGANVSEAEVAPSKKDFVNKLSISLKETRETNYWLRLLRDSEIIETKLAESFISEIEEIQKIITAIIKTSKQSL
jgi:four helix bundle protein